MSVHSKIDMVKLEVYCQNATLRDPFRYWYKKTAYEMLKVDMYTYLDRILRVQLQKFISLLFL